MLSYTETQVHIKHTSWIPSGKISEELFRNLVKSTESFLCNIFYCICKESQAHTNNITGEPGEKLQTYTRLAPMSLNKSSLKASKAPEEYALNN